MRRVAPVIGVSVFLLAMLGAGFVVGLGGAAPATQHNSGTHGVRHRAHARVDHAGGNALDQLGAAEAVQLAPATTTPVAATAALVSQQPLAAREDFAFAPYWTLPQSPGFSLTGLSTIAYFSVDVNPNGTLDESGPGWNGFESQALADLITRAHAAGERVVLTVTDFDQGSLDAITSSPSAPASLSSALIPLLQSKALDGVNFDFEGAGSRDQSGLTNLVTAVSGALRAADPHWQITMDTYASSAGDPSGFYNIPALAPAVDAFFVMDYELNLRGAPSAASPLTSGQFSSLTTMKQYTAAVPASKVILGVPFFGIDWPTNNGTMAANAAGGAADIPDSQAAANGPEYWDPVTETAWTSYQVGNQWHESYYEGAFGLYRLSQMTSYFGARGVGIWALGMENDGARLIAALDGISPGGPGGAGPQATSTSPAPAAPPPAAAPGPAPAPAPAPAPSPHPAPGGQPGTTTTQPSGSGGGASGSTTTTTPSTITGVYNGKTVTLTPVTPSSVVAVVQTGTLTNFQSTNPAYACLNGQSLSVYQNVDTKMVAVPSTSACVKEDFEFSS